jgi:membrane associated rhomboid family serine protease
MFMHHPTFYMHILFNMLGIYMFGSPLEEMWGRNKFLFFYFSSGIGAVLLPLAIDYYQFSSSINLLVESGYNQSDVLSILNEEKYNPQWAEVLGDSKLKSFLTAFNTSSLGASGALMGLLVAFGLSFPNVGLMLIFLPIPIKAKYFIPVLLAYEVVSGFMGGSSIFGVNVAHWAHVGGALTGFIMAYYWKKNSFNNKRWN